MGRVWMTLGVCLVLTLLRMASGMPALLDPMGPPGTHRGLYQVTDLVGLYQVSSLEPDSDPISYLRGLDDPPEVTLADEWEEPAVTSSAPTLSTPAPSPPAPGTPPPTPAEGPMTPGTITGIVIAALFVTGVVGIMAVSFARPEWVKCFTRVTPHGMP